MTKKIMLAVLGFIVHAAAIGPISLSVCIGTGCKPTKTSSVASTAACTPAASQLVKNPGFAANLDNYQVTEAGAGRSSIQFDTGTRDDNTNTKSL